MIHTLTSDLYLHVWPWPCDIELEKGQYRFYLLPFWDNPSVIIGFIWTCHLNGLWEHFYSYILLFDRGPWPIILLLRNELFCSLLFCFQLYGLLLFLNSPDRQKEWWMQQSNYNIYSPSPIMWKGIIKNIRLQEPK